MKTGSIVIIIAGCIFAVIESIRVFYGAFLPALFNILVGTLLIIIGVFHNKGCYNKNFFMAIFSVIALWGLMLLYIFLFRTSEYLEWKNIFYLLIGLFVLLIITFGGPYIRRLKKGDL
ncbi:hypothetical protein [Methanobacterium formicicum]|jgi:hypothetical protein|uniref:Putative membrane protein n=1 Tax=Methanobacterium formicicum TaxID=2162 RepID=A0A090I680_METFO|nr:hypothetical protein [Methanobacterium formicicum]MDH2659336.1 hypothetical protein [Methanobacterium formicicum]CEA13605.1 putative membrane protein [Methanobacterium formicicum]